MSAKALLRQSAIFAALDEPALDRLAARCVSRTVGPGHVLFTTGEECRGLYFVEDGRVRIYRTSPDGKEQVLHVEGPGRPVAELPLFDGGPYPASAITIEETRLVFLPRADFEHLYRAYPDIAHAIIQGLGRRLRHLVHVAETLAFRDVAARLALLLVGYAERSGRSTPAGVVVTLDRTQEELALEIGAARESVSRALKQLRRTGLIQSAGDDELIIPDVARLRALLPFSDEDRPLPP
ncbi:MAG TPA: Crp/Fnr family transcriptional regulator [Gemmatimonadaceae bacterium]|nr:Crp/Fnr family transcriptional regulator [Gemmatimonadaceae bacterium]